MNHLKRILIGFIIIASVLSAAVIISGIGHALYWLIDHWKYGQWVFISGAVLFLCYMFGALYEVFGVN